MLEISLENKCVLHFESKYAGSMPKLEEKGKRSFPDRTMLANMLANSLIDMIVFVEFKVPGKEPDPGQQEKINELRDLGHFVYVCDNFNHFEQICEYHFGERRPDAPLPAYGWPKNSG